MSARALGPSLVVEILPNGRTARLVGDFEISDGAALYSAHDGFVTDFASVPRALWYVLPPWGRYSRAAVIHDHLYRHGDCTRAEADRAFLSLMAATGVGWLTRWLMYLAVRAFGGQYYNRRAAEKRPRKGGPRCP